MGKFFLLLGKNNGHKRRDFSSFPFSNLETREYSSDFSNFFLIFSDPSPNFSEISPILSDENKIPSDVFKIAREEKEIPWDIIRKMSLKIARTTCRFIINDVLFLENEGISYKNV